MREIAVNRSVIAEHGGTVAARNCYSFTYAGCMRRYFAA
jgi:hypothetical protein